MRPLLAVVVFAGGRDISIPAAVFESLLWAVAVATALLVLRKKFSAEVVFLGVLAHIGHGFGINPVWLRFGWLAAMGMLFMLSGPFSVLLPSLAYLCIGRRLKKEAAARKEVET